jgi:hypothetical protein
MVLMLGKDRAHAEDTTQQFDMRHENISVPRKPPSIITCQALRKPHSSITCYFLRKPRSNIT